MQVLPMGWKSAVGVMQAIHRRLLASSLKNGRRLPTAAEIQKTAEIRKTAPMPASTDQWTLTGWQVYLDNFASFLIVLTREAQQWEGTASEFLDRARKAWAAWNIPSAADKSVTSVHSTGVRVLYRRPHLPSELVDGASCSSLGGRCVMSSSKPGGQSAISGIANVCLSLFAASSSTLPSLPRSWLPAFGRGRTYSSRARTLAPRVRA